MKQSRRHELKQNELAQSLTDLKEWLNKYVNYVIAGAVAVVAIIGIASYSAKQRTSQFEQGWADHQATIDDYSKAVGSVGRGANASIPPNVEAMGQALNNMQLVADKYSEDEDLAARSLLWIGDQALRQLATTRSGSSDPGALRLLDQAEKALQRVTNQFVNRPIDVAIAMLGLATIAEERGQFDQAKKIYEEVSGLEGAELLPMANLAKAKLDEVDHYSKPVTFASPPRPPPPTTQPFTELVIPPAPTSPTSAPTTQPFTELVIPPAPTLPTSAPTTQPSAAAAPTTQPSAAAPTTQPAKP